MTAQSAPPINGADPRFAAGAWYLSQGFLAFTLWGTDERGVCRCPKGASCDQKPGKHPVADNLAGWHGFKDATDEPARLATLLRAGSRPNLGVLVPEGCFGWDLDGEDAERITALQASLGPLSSTMGHETPNGRHAVYRWPAEVPCPGGHLLGVVTRWRDNGYLVGASSRIGTKVYRLRRDEAGEPLPIVDFPRPWVDAAVRHRPAVRPPAGETATGKRHPDLLSTARHLAGRGVRGEALVAALLAVNAEYPGGAKPEAEVRDIVAWADAKVPDDPDLDTGNTSIAAEADPGAIGKVEKFAAGPPAHLVRQSRAAWHFAKLAGDRVRFDHGRGRWLIWAGHRWRPDEDGSVRRLWLTVLGRRYAAAVKIPDDAVRLPMIEAVRAAGATNAAISAGLEIASSMQPIATKADAWDPDPWLIGCDNGVVNLRDGILRDGRPEDMISRSTGVVYDPGAACPRWMRFLSEVFAGDKELVDWYGLLIGTSLIGIVQELLAIHHGLGNNGKSVAVRAERHAFGDYAVVIPVETLVNAKRGAGEATPDLMALRGARIAFTSEPDQTAKLRGGVLKRLASIDSMTGRPLYGMTQTWDPTHTVHLSTNHLPEVDDATDGFWRRVALIPWPVHFRKAGEAGDGPEEDPGLTATLTREGPGILAWAVRGAMASAGGQSLHPFPAAVRGRTEEYRKAEDRIGGFIAEHVDYDADATVLQSALFAAYKGWCDVEGLDRLDRLGPKKFPAEFLERGRVRRAEDEKKRHIFRGARLRLSTNPENPENLGPFADFSESLLHEKVPENASDSPDSPETGGGQPLDLYAEGLRIFGDDLIGGVA